MCFGEGKEVKTGVGRVRKTALCVSLAWVTHESCTRFVDAKCDFLTKENHYHYHCSGVCHFAPGLHIYISSFVTSTSKL